MSENEARQYVDLVIETLLEWGVIHPEKYGRITEDQNQQLADMVVAKSEE